MAKHRAGVKGGMRLYRLLRRPAERMTFSRGQPRTFGIVLSRSRFQRQPLFQTGFREASVLTSQEQQEPDRRDAGGNNSRRRHGQQEGALASSSAGAGDVGKLSIFSPQGNVCWNRRSLIVSMRDVKSCLLAITPPSIQPGTC